MIRIDQKQSGFALLISILVIGVIVAVTLAIVELSLKQLELSVDSRDSEVAFHAANAGMECAQRARRISSSTIEAGNDFTVECFETSAVAGSRDDVHIRSGASNGEVHRHVALLDWDSGTEARCSEINMISIMADTGAIVIGSNSDNADSLQRLIPNYPAHSKSCAAGARCTIASVSGYSSTCAQRNGVGTLKREILLEF